MGSLLLLSKNKLVHTMSSFDGLSGESRMETWGLGQQTDSVFQCESCSLYGDMGILLRFMKNKHRFILLLFCFSVDLKIYIQLLLFYSHR